MRSLVQHLKGDRAMWGLLALLGLFSFLPVYSASAQLELQHSTTSFEIAKHGIIILLGFVIIYTVHRIPAHYFKGLSLVGLPISLVLLTIPLFFAGGDNDQAQRWIRVMPGLQFQPSSVAMVALMVWIARYLAKTRDVSVTFKESFLPLWVPIGLVFLFIVPANLSTALMVVVLSLLLCFIGGYPQKYLALVCGSGLLVAGALLFVMMATPKEELPGRASTWKSRIEAFSSPKDARRGANDQTDYAKVAIHSGSIVGKGAGKSRTRTLLPESTTDFIYAIIIEEYGLLGGVALLGIYLLLLFRILVSANGADSLFKRLLIVGLGLPIIFQALINMGVVVNLFPVTGQPLPLISRGGTAIWTTCMALGIVLSASERQDRSDTTADRGENNPLDILRGQL